MTSKLHRWLVASMIAAALGLAYTSSPSQANQPNAIEKSIKEIAGEFAKGKEEAARKLAIACAKKIDDLPDLMEMFKPEKKGGLGIEAKLKGLEKVANAKIAAEVSPLSAAMAEVILAKTPAKDGPQGKTKKLWMESADTLRTASLDLAKAAAKNDAKAIKAAAEKANNACITCHSKFK